MVVRKSIPSGWKFEPISDTLTSSVLEGRLELLATLTSLRSLVCERPRDHGDDSTDRHGNPEMLCYIALKKYESCGEGVVDLEARDERSHSGDSMGLAKARLLPKGDFTLGSYK